MPVPGKRHIDTSLTQSPVAGARTVLVEGPSADERIAIAPNEPFYYVHYGAYEGNWFVGEIEAGEGVPPEEVGPWWLPKLQAEPVRPGLNLHRTLKPGEPRNAMHRGAHEAIRDAGGVILPRELGYMTSLPAIHPFTKAEGTFYFDVWSSPRPRVPGQAQKWNFDRQRFYRWLLNLMVQGHIEPPNDLIIELKKRSKKARVLRREDQWELPVEKRMELLEEAAGGLAQVEAAQVPEAEPVPARKLKPRASAPEQG